MRTVLFVSLVVVACSGDPASTGQPEDGGTGGALATGGATATGGRRATGGAATGGASTGGVATGGDPSTGGAPYDGGADADASDAADSSDTQVDGNATDSAGDTTPDATSDSDAPDTFDGAPAPITGMPDWCAPDGAVIYAGSFPATQVLCGESCALCGFDYFIERTACQGEQCVFACGPGFVKLDANSQPLADQGFGAYPPGGCAFVCPGGALNIASVDTMWAPAAISGGSTCPVGYLNCDCDAGNGCEVYVGSDPRCPVHDGG
jgi:hypothetical protein